MNRSDSQHQLVADQIDALIQECRALERRIQKTLDDEQSPSSSTTRSTHNETRQED